MKKHLLYWLALGIIVVAGCQKELSFEGSRTPAEGSLQSEASGDCLPKLVNGIYEAAKPLVADTNTIEVSVNVTRTGSYTVYTDTVNGYHFRGTGLFTVTGVNTVKLQSSGTPFVAGVNNFKVFFDSTECDIAVPVIPAGAGSSPAVFTLVNGGNPANCATAVVNGTYVKDATTGASNFVNITVNVTTIGTYTIRATGGGMTFQKTSVFTATGTQTIDLPASGTPTTTGANTITFDAPLNTCNFTVDVTAAPPTSDLKWKFTEGATTYEGPTTGAAEATSMGFSTVAISGTSTAPNGDFAFLLNLAKTGSISTGAYASNSATTPVVFTLINTSTTQTVYSGNFGNGVNLTVNLTTFNTVIKVVEGNFSGTVKDAANTTRTTTAGTFKAMLP